MISEIESSVYNYAVSHNAECENECSCGYQHKRHLVNLTNHFSQFRSSEPEIIVLGSVCSDCDRIDEIQISGVSCLNAPVNFPTHTSNLVHNSLNITFKEPDEWRPLSCDPYWDGFNYKFHLTLNFDLKCADCGKKITTFTFYVQFESEKGNLFNHSTIDKLATHILHAKDQTVDQFNHLGVRFPYSATVDLGASSLTDAVSFPYSDVLGWFKDTLIELIVLPDIDGRRFYHKEIRSLNNQIVFELKKVPTENQQ